VRFTTDRLKKIGLEGGDIGSHLARGAIALAVVGLALLPLLVTLPRLGSDAAAGKPPAAATGSLGPAASAAGASSSSITLPSASPNPPPPPPKPAVPVVVVPQLYPHVGSSGPDVLALEQRLASLSYMVGNVDGVFDQATRHGLIAFQKVEGLERSGVADAGTTIRLESASIPAPAYTQPPDHLEIDIKRQVVFVVRGGAVTAVLPTSTGSGRKFTSEGYTRRAITPNGVFTIAYKQTGWRKSPLGMLYRPAYFNGGIAFHGAPSVPTAPASHGCVRLPMPFADWFADNISLVGTTVYAYGGPVGDNPAPVLTDAPAAPPAPGASDLPSDSSAPNGTPSPSSEAPASPSPSPSPGLLPGLLNP
jgi:peptidoglycan hydrolase-like protein with peptidoglycan-binding domain